MKVKPRYILKQPHAKTCGVVAIVNILRSFGAKVSYKQILKEAGGLKKVNKNGMALGPIVRILRSHNLEVLPIQVSYKRMKEFAVHPNATVAVCYAFIVDVKRVGNKIQYLGGSHIVMINKNGKAINTGKKSRVTPRRWKDTMRVHGQPPVTLICVPKRGGVKS